LGGLPRERTHTEVANTSGRRGEGPKCFVGESVGVLEELGERKTSAREGARKRKTEYHVRAGPYHATKLKREQLQ